VNDSIRAHLEAFNDPREGVRLFAARKLATYGAEVCPLLIELLKDKTGYKRDCAAMALLKMGSIAIPFLVLALRHSERSIRWESATLLSGMGEEARAALDEASAANSSAACY
jgi:HEAT repeat protein